MSLPKNPETYTYQDDDELTPITMPIVTMWVLGFWSFVVLVVYIIFRV